MTKIKTTKGTINNNTLKHKITKDTATIFNFCIDNVTLENDTLTVTCTTITGDTVEYSFDIASDTKELPKKLENLNVAGDVNLFLALAYRIYESGLEQSDTPTGDCTELQARIAELEAQLPSPTTVSYGIGFDISDCTFIMNGYSQGSGGEMTTAGAIRISIPGEFSEAEMNAYAPKASSLTEVTAVKINDQPVQYTNSSTGNTLQLFPTANQISWTSSDPIQTSTGQVKFTVEILNKQTNTTVTLEDTYDTSTQEWTGGGAIVNYNPEWNLRVEPQEGGAPLVVTLDVHIVPSHIWDYSDSDNIVEFMLNNETISVNNIRCNRNTVDNKMEYTITIPSNELADGENIIQYHIPQTKDTMETTTSYTYNTQGGGELTLKPYVTIQPTVTTATTNNFTNITAQVTPYNLPDGERIIIKTNVDPENSLPSSGQSLMHGIYSDVTIPLFAIQATSSGTINYTTIAVLEQTGEIINTYNGTVQVTT